MRSFEYFGGSTAIVVPDNLRSGVSRACRYDPDLNPSYQQWAEHYQTAVVPARPYKPKDKAKAEVGVQIVERWIMARLLVTWCKANGVMLNYIEPGRPDQNAFIERFNRSY